MVLKVYLFHTVEKWWIVINSVLMFKSIIKLYCIVYWDYLNCLKIFFELEISEIFNPISGWK